MAGQSFDKLYYFEDERTWIDRKARGKAIRTTWTLTIGPGSLFLRSKRGEEDVTLSGVRAISMALKGMGDEPAIEVICGSEAKSAFIGSAKLAGTRKHLDEIMRAIKAAQHSVEVGPDWKVGSDKPTASRELQADEEQIGREARELVRRVAETRQAGPTDREQVEECLARYFRVLELSPRSVRWIEDPWPKRCATGYTAAWTERKAEKEVGPSATEEKKVLDEAVRAAEAADEGIERAAQAADAAGTTILRERVKRIAGWMADAWAWHPSRSPTGGLWSSTWQGTTGLALGGFIGETIGEAVAEKKAARAHAGLALAGSRGILAAEWTARRWALHGLGLNVPAVDWMVELNLPFVDAWEAGLCLFWITPDEVIAVGREEGRLSKPPPPNEGG